MNEIIRNNFEKNGSDQMPTEAELAEVLVDRAVLAASMGRPEGTGFDGQYSVVRYDDDGAENIMSAASEAVVTETNIVNALRDLEDRILANDSEIGKLRDILKRIKPEDDLAGENKRKLEREIADNNRANLTLTAAHKRLEALLGQCQ